MTDEVVRFHTCPPVERFMVSAMDKTTLAGGTKTVATVKVLEMFWYGRFNSYPSKVTLKI